MSKRKPLPAVPQGTDEQQRFDAAVKQRLQLFSGELGGQVALLDTSTATAADCASKINELIKLLQSAYH